MRCRQRSWNFALENFNQRVGPGDVGVLGVLTQMKISPKVVYAQAHNPPTIHRWLEDAGGLPTAPVAPVTHRVDQFDAVGVVHAE